MITNTQGEAPGAQGHDMDEMADNNEQGILHQGH